MRVLPVLPALIALLAACGGPAEPADPPACDPAAPPAAAPDDGPLLIAEGATVRIPSNGAVSVTVAGAPGTVGARPAEGGVEVTGLAAGNGRIDVVDASGRQGSVEVEVRPVASAEVRLEVGDGARPASLIVSGAVLTPGTVARLRAVHRDAEGRPLLADGLVRWTSSDPGATVPVDADGVATVPFAYRATPLSVGTNLGATVELVFADHPALRGLGLAGDGDLLQRVSLAAGGCTAAHVVAWDPEQRPVLLRADTPVGARVEGDVADVGPGAGPFELFFHARAAGDGTLVVDLDGRTLRVPLFVRDR